MHMSLVDWSWGEKYYTPTLDMSPTAVSMGHYANAASYFISVPVQAQPVASVSAPQWTTLPPPQANVQAPLKNSRKRSRDETDNEDDSSRSNTDPFPSQRPTPSPPKREVVLGPGMTMICGDGPVVDASPQTGTWAEELSERLRTSKLARDERKRPGLESRKSIRLDRSEVRMDDVAASALPKEARFAVDPTIDEASVALGIGWSTIPSAPAMAAAARGWARHIETHFPLQFVQIIWRNNSIPAYLVSAVSESRARHRSPIPCPTQSWHHQSGSSGYYLFDEAMTQGRLVAKSWERALDNLRGVPLRFEGEQMMESDADEVVRYSEQNNLQHWDWEHAISRSATPITMENGGDGMDLD